MTDRSSPPPVAADARFYLRVTLVVAAGMAAGALLEWMPAEPSPWRWLPLGVAYLVGGARIARDSWATLRDERKLSIDFLMGAAALVDEAGHETGRIPVAELRRGQRILVRPGERIAADGQVASGRSVVDQSAITGESVPVPRHPGDEVFAGTINIGGALVVRVTREAGDTMLARIVRLVE